MDIFPLRALRRYLALTLGGAACVVGLAACGGGSTPATPPAPVTPPAPPTPLPSAPVIAAQPSTLTVNPGQDATFSVSASGTGPLSYQWSRNGVPIAGATGATYTLPAPQPVDSADVLRVSVRNATGVIDSEPAVLLVGGSGVRTLAGPGGKSLFTPGLFSPSKGIAPHPGGGIYQIDGQKLLRISADGKITVLSDTGCFLGGGAADKDGNFVALCAPFLVKFGPDGARLPSPAPESHLARGGFGVELAIDAQNIIHVADAANNILWRVDAAGVVVRVAGAGTATGFTRLGAIAVDPRGGVLVTDGHALRAVSATGVVTTLAGAVGESGSRDGKGGEARFYYPGGLVVDPAGTVYVSDTENRVIRKVSAAGEVSTLAGGGGEYRNEDGAGKLAGFSRPRALILDTQGNLLVSDTDTLRKVTPGGVVTTVAGTLPRERDRAWIDGAAREARLDGVGGMVRDSAGNLFVADTRNHAVRKVTPAGIVTTLVGGPHKYPSADGTLATAALQYPGKIALGPNGVLYVADGQYSGMASSLRKIAADGVVSTLALPADPRAPARITALAADTAGNVFVATFAQQAPGQCGAISCEHSVAVRRIAPDGKDTVLLTNAFARVPVNHVSALATDRGGNIYVLTGETILKIAPDGAVAILLAADKSAFRFMTAMTVDANDNVIFATTIFLSLPESPPPASTWPHGAVGKVTPQGVLSVLASPYAGDPAVSRMDWSTDGQGIAVDAGGVLYLSSYGSIFKVVP